MNKTLLLKCPRCSNKMKYQARGSLHGKKKQCVYCGKGYRVEGNVVSQ